MEFLITVPATRACGDLSHANVRRTAAVSGAHSGNIDSVDSKVVELHCRHLSDRDRHFGTGANVVFNRSNAAASQKGRKAKAHFAERRTCRC